MSSERTLLFVGAHPDDESFGLGGTLAHYAGAGVKVYYVCATRGEVGTIAPEYLQGYASPGDCRWDELTCAAQALGLTGVIHLGYRDSGMPGSPDNHHPEALAAAPLEEVTGRVVKVLRELRPQVVITFDPIGGYRHPDHIAIHLATVAAFQAAANPARFPEHGSAYQPQKLYYIVFSRAFLKLVVRVLPFFGRDPRRFGRNADIDIASLVEVDYPPTVYIPVRGEAARRRDTASACHRSQLDEGTNGRGVMGTVARLLQNRDGFMRVYPPLERGQPPERDLFEGVR
jgi:N-acetyl-1-D-myo-inositol-2-amino-2-deoxy-alpha-D-glucopyranoside deacetylase